MQIIPIYLSIRKQTRALSDSDLAMRCIAKEASISRRLLGMARQQKTARSGKSDLIQTSMFRHSKNTVNITTLHNFYDTMEGVILHTGQILSSAHVVSRGQADLSFGTSRY